ncbi:MAG: hypothetical protein GKS07_04905 [Nitrosopumilus sp.]|nr:MAG: hypothetical protein GKS07_04905 [Nitrosopumilus sp.]
MQEIVLILSSLAGVATAAAIRRVPKDKNQLISLGASSQIKSQITSLKIEKDILTKTISRLYQTESDFPRIQKNKLLLKYQHQLGIILARLEKLEQASNHPDLGPVGNGLITLMDQKLSKLDDRLHELSSKITSTKVETQEKIPEVKQESKSRSDTAFNFEKPKENKIEPVEIPPTKSRQSFELTTLTSVSKTEPKFPSFEESRQVIKPMPQPRVMKTELVNPKEVAVQEIIQTKPKVEDKIEIVQSVYPKPTVELKPDIDAKIAKITEHKALPEPVKEKQVTQDDDFDDDADDLDKIKGDIMKVLSKLDQAEVE